MPLDDMGLAPNAPLPESAWQAASQEAQRVRKDALKAAGKTLFDGEAGDFEDAGDDDRALGSERARSLHQSLKGSYLRELDRQNPNRREMETDEALYDHIHWDPRDAMILEERGQVPLVFNVTKTAVDWVLGSQRRRPLDYKILPRKRSGLRHAEIKTQLMKYFADVSDETIHLSRAFAEQVKAGLGWLECGVQDEDAGEIIYERYESWRNVLPDSSAQALDFSDGRYLFRVKWTDTDRALAMFPRSRATIIGSSDRLFDPRGLGQHTTGDSAMDSAEEMDDYLSGEGISYPTRRRVRLYEAWFRKPIQELYLKGGEFSGEIFDPYSDGHTWSLLSQPRTEVVSKVRERMMLAIFCDEGLLWLSRSPYRHNQFPFTPLWGYRRAHDGMPYGLIRGVRDIQFDINKRASKALWHITAKRVFTTKGAVDDIEELREEIARPDAVVEVNPGFQAPTVESDLQHAAAQMDMMARDMTLIEQISGVTRENTGRPSSASQSGRAILALQDQGEVTTNVFFENMRFGRKKHGEKMLSLIEQFVDQEREFRVTDSRGHPDYIAVNDLSGEDNWITRTKADFIVDEIDYRATSRQMNVAALMEFATNFAASSPEIAIGMLDLIIQELDLPHSEEMVKRVRQITGFADPDEDPDNPSPETLAVQQRQAEEAAMQQRAMEAEIGAKEAKRTEAEARALKIIADAATVRSRRESDELAKMSEAFRLIMEAAGAPDVAAAADRILQRAKEEAAVYDVPAPQEPPAGAVAQPAEIGPTAADMEMMQAAGQAQIPDAAPPAMPEEVYHPTATEGAF